MRILEFTKIAFLSLVTNKIRAILTMLGIIIGVMSVILLVSIGTGLQSFVTKQFASLGSNTIFVLPGKVDFRSGGPTTPVSKFELTDVSDITRGSASVLHVSPAVAQNATITAKGKTVGTEIAGVWENYFLIQNFTAETGDIIRQSDVERTRKTIVLGPKPATELFGDADPIGQWVTLGAVRYQIKGVLVSKGGGGALGADIDNHAFIPLTSALRQFNQNKPYMLLIQATAPESVDQAAADVKRILSRRLKDDDFTVMQQTELLNTINQFLGAITVALGGIAAISLLVGGIGIMNIMLVSVTERTREIGLRKAIGATPKDILLQFLIEAVILSLTGGAIGILLGALGSLALRSFVQTSVTLWSVALASGFSAAIGIIFGVAPAIRASRLDPIEALRYE
ncbi:ABC transporter permease [Candidatus Gottesmanbacteria bacterium]|nr:ABC transporter permease [Candidatus Gottesmanbacteria bacterium]